MRIVGEIPHPECKVTIFSWNNRYLIKLELGMFEQTFKINQFDVTDEKELFEIIDDSFIQEGIKRFDTMQKGLEEAISRSLS
jgi:hypothetical protein